MQIFPKKLNLKSVFFISLYTAILPIIFAAATFTSKSDGLGTLLALGQILKFWLVLVIIALVVMIVKAQETDQKNQLWYSLVFIIFNVALFYFSIAFLNLFQSSRENKMQAKPYDAVGSRGY